MKYSVVVPVYNAEKTLRRCVESVLGQNHNSLELLLIDDGSTDLSGEICRKYRDSYENVRYFYQENSGVSAARNKGLDEVNGKYVLFLDSDDYMSNDCLETVDAVLGSAETDLVLLRKDYTSGKSANAAYSPEMNGREMTFCHKAKDLLLQRQLDSLPAKIFSGEIIRSNHLRFKNELCVGEDSLFVFMYVLCAKSVYCCNHTVYHIDVSNGSSLTRRPRPYLCEQFQIMHKEMLSQLQMSSLTEDEKLLLWRAVSWSYYRSAYSCCKDLRKSDWSACRRWVEIRNICSKYIESGIKPSGWKCWLIAIPVRMNIAFMIDLLISVHK